jgi:hypothetical protein
MKVRATGNRVAVMTGVSMADKVLVARKMVVMVTEMGMAAGKVRVVAMDAEMEVLAPHLTRCKRASLP